SLGKDEARRRIANNIHRLTDFFPGGGHVESGWAGDQLNLSVHALGDSVQSTIDVEETKVHLKVLLPGLLGAFAGPIQAALQKKAYGGEARIDILDRYPVPYGLIRFGVAPDHQSLKAVSKRYDKVAECAGVDFIGNVTVGRDVSVAELLDVYDAVILAIGAPHDRKLGIPGDELPGVVGSAGFVGWYNGHPEFADLDP